VVVGAEWEPLTPDPVITFRPAFRRFLIAPYQPFRGGPLPQSLNSRGQVLRGQERDAARTRRDDSGSPQRLGSQHLRICLWVLGGAVRQEPCGAAMKDVNSRVPRQGSRWVWPRFDSARQPDGNCARIPEFAITRRMYLNGESEYSSTRAHAPDGHPDSALGFGPRTDNALDIAGRLDEVLNSRLKSAARSLKNGGRAQAQEAQGARDPQASGWTPLERAAHRERDRPPASPLERQASKSQQHSGSSAELRDLELSLESTSCAPFS